MSQTDMTALLSPLDVSRLLGVSIATVKRLTATGELSHIRVTHRRPRYRADDVRAFLAARRFGDPRGTSVPDVLPDRQLTENERSPTEQPSSFAKSAETGGGDEKR